jgi:hypothetical protein
MGRYYSGDIEGKFWFGVQPSNCANRFGSTGCEPNYLDYYFNEDNLPEIRKELKAIEDKLGDWMQKFDKFFQDVNGYNEQIIESYGLDVKEFNKYLSDYADYGLGKQILECVEKTGSCFFEAEL